MTVEEPKELKHLKDSAPTEPHVRVGWCSSKFVLEAPVGFDRHGFSYRDISSHVKGGVDGGGSVFSRARGRPYGEGYGVGDTIGWRVTSRESPRCSLVGSRHHSDPLRNS